MTRKQFLRITGLATLGLFGVGNVLALLEKPQSAPPPTPDERKGFGSRKFGA